jgi:hypothetical protein
MQALTACGWTGIAEGIWTPELCVIGEKLRLVVIRGYDGPSRPLFNRTKLRPWDAYDWRIWLRLGKFIVTLHYQGVLCA